MDVSGQMDLNLNLFLINLDALSMRRADTIAGKHINDGDEVQRYTGMCGW